MQKVHLYVSTNKYLDADKTENGPYDRTTDSNGAIMFIIITLCVYSLGITAFIAGHIYKRKENKIVDMQISEFLAASTRLTHHENMERIKVTSVQCKKFLEDIPMDTPKERTESQEVDSIVDISIHDIDDSEPAVDCLNKINGRCVRFSDNKQVTRDIEIVKSVDTVTSCRVKSADALTSRDVKSADAVTSCDLKSVGTGTSRDVKSVDTWTSRDVMMVGLNDVETF
ncbi:hypothetical protein ACF0H5_005199 [Mactra antiquata]